MVSKTNDAYSDLIYKLWVIFFFSKKINKNKQDKQPEADNFTNFYNNEIILELKIIIDEMKGFYEKFQSVMVNKEQQLSQLIKKLHDSPYKLEMLPDKLKLQKQTFTYEKDSYQKKFDTFLSCSQSLKKITETFMNVKWFLSNSKKKFQNTLIDEEFSRTKFIRARDNYEEQAITCLIKYTTNFDFSLEGDFDFDAYTKDNKELNGKQLLYHNNMIDYEKKQKSYLAMTPRGSDKQYLESFDLISEFLRGSDEFFDRKLDTLISVGYETSTETAQSLKQSLSNMIDQLPSLETFVWLEDISMANKKYYGTNYSSSPNKKKSQAVNNNDGRSKHTRKYSTINDKNLLTSELVVSSNRKDEGIRDMSRTFLNRMFSTGSSRERQPTNKIKSHHEINDNFREKRQIELQRPNTDIKKFKSFIGNYMGNPFVNRNKVNLSDTLKNEIDSHTKCYRNYLANISKQIQLQVQSKMPQTHNKSITNYQEGEQNDIPEERPEEPKKERFKLEITKEVEIKALELLEIRKEALEEDQDFLINMFINIWQGKGYTNHTYECYKMIVQKSGYQIFIGYILESFRIVNKKYIPSKKAYNEQVKVLNQCLYSSFINKDITFPAIALQLGGAYLYKPSEQTTPQKSPEIKCERLSPKKEEREYYQKEGLKINSIWKDDDFWVTFLLHKITEIIQRGSGDANSSIDLDILETQRKNQLFFGFYEVACFMKLMERSKENIADIVTKYMAMYNLGSEQIENLLEMLK